VIKEIFAQKESLRYLVELLEASKISEDSKYIIADLSDLKKTLDAKADNVFTPDALREVDSKATALRTKVISSK
jgi:hypothetical protein